MKNIGIFGIGAIGSVLSKYLAGNPNNNYFFYNRSKKEIIKIDFGNEHTTVKISLEENEEVKLDWLMVCLKEYHYKNAKTRLKKLIGPKTKIAVFRNGLDLGVFFESFTDNQFILETIIDCPTQKGSNDQYIQLRRPKIIVSNNLLASDFKELLDSADIELTRTDNFKIEQWVKLIESSSLGSLQAYIRQPCSLIKDDSNLEILKDLIYEGIKVAKSENVILETRFFEKLLQKIKEYPPTKGSSMLTDILAGNQLELEAKIGVILQKAKKNEIDVPVSNRIYNELLTKQ